MFNKNKKRLMRYVNYTQLIENHPLFIKGFSVLYSSKTEEHENHSLRYITLVKRQILNDFQKEIKFFNIVDKIFSIRFLINNMIETKINHYFIIKYGK